MATYTNSRIQLRVDTEGAWQSNNPTIQAGEICISSDKLDFKVGAGSAWNQAAYCIKNNPEVVSIKTTANNAASSASSAMNRANQAYSIAQAAAQSAGRVVNFDVLKEAVENQQPISITAAFLKEHQNTDFMLTNGGLITATEIDITTNELPEGSSNDIAFYFYAAENVYVKSNLFSEIPVDGKIVVTIFNDDMSIKDMFNDVDTITFPAGYLCEVHLINGCILKYTACEWV